MAFIHGMNNTPIHKAWKSMITRCKPRNAKRYPNYAGRGIYVCKEWLKFETFYKDMGDEYRPGLELDRINNDGHYEPGNVRWATNRTNSNNKRTNHFVTINGKTKTIAEWARESGVDYRTLRNRIVSNWPENQLLSKATQNRKKLSKWKLKGTF